MKTEQPHFLVIQNLVQCQKYGTENQEETNTGRTGFRAISRTDGENETGTQSGRKNKIERIKNALKIFPDEITYLLNEYEKKGNFKDGIRLIKSLNLDWKEYNKVWDRYSIRIFYYLYYNQNQGILGYS